MDFLEMMHADSMREAAGLLAWRGYDNVQAAGLAQAMRMSVGSMYRHYGSNRRLGAGGRSTSCTA
jgi:AcrR family transcriptional regulator